MQLPNFLPTWERKVLRVGRFEEISRIMSLRTCSKEGLFAVAKGEGGGNTQTAESIVNFSRDVIKDSDTYRVATWNMEHQCYIGLAGHPVHEYTD